MRTTSINKDNLKNEDELKKGWGVVDWVPKQWFQPLIPLEVAHWCLFGTITRRLGSARLNPIVIIRLSQLASRAWAWARLSLTMIKWLKDQNSMVFNQPLLPTKVIFHQWMPFIKGCLPSKSVFYQKSSSTKGKVREGYLTFPKVMLSAECPFFSLTSKSV